MKRTFKDKVILVTGASGNLGTEICLRFAKAGAKIAAADLREADLIALQEQLKPYTNDVLLLAGDITESTHCEVMVAQILERWKRLDGVINNAGITHIQRYTSMENRLAMVRKIMEVNFFGSVNCTEAALASIRANQGFLVAISSVAGFAPLLGRTAYAASKHALHGFFESLHSELQEEGVHVLMVCPSFIQAPANNKSNSANNGIYQDKKTIGKTTSASSIADQIYTYCAQEKPLLVAGRTGRISHWLHRYMPRLYRHLMIKNLRSSLP